MDGSCCGGKMETKAKKMIRRVAPFVLNFSMGLSGQINPDQAGNGKQKAAQPCLADTSLARLHEQKLLPHITVN